MTQKEMILRHLRDYGTITPVDALREYGCMRLGARIYDLKRAGYSISSELMESVNRYGARVAYAKYTLNGDQHDSERISVAGLADR